MIGRRAFAIAGGGSLALARPTSSQEWQSWTLHPIEHPQFNWRLVARSDLIVRGILAISGDTAAALKQGGPYVSVPLAVGRVFKGGERQGALDFRYHPGANRGGPGADALMALNARDAILYLASGPEDAYRLADDSPEVVSILSAPYQRALLKEVETQTALARRAADLLSRHQPPFEASVGAAVRAALAGDSQAALGGLRRSGLAAAPAMIARLDDRRRLPRTKIEVSVDRAAEVAEVADLMMLALGLVVKGVGFGHPSPQTPDERRQRMADAWRVWLGYSLGLGGQG